MWACSALELVGEEIMTEEHSKLNQFRDKEVQDRLQRLADGWSGYNLGYVYDELYEIADIVWSMMDEGDSD